MSENTPGSITPKNWLFAITALFITVIIAVTVIVWKKSDSNMTGQVSQKVQKTAVKTDSDLIDYDNVKPSKQEESLDPSSDYKEKAKIEAAAKKKFESMGVDGQTELIKFDKNKIMPDDQVIKTIIGYKPGQDVFYACGENLPNGLLSANGWLNSWAPGKYDQWIVKKDADGDWFINAPQLLKGNFCQIDIDSVSGRPVVRYAMLHYFSLADWYYENSAGANHRVAVNPPGSAPEYINGRPVLARKN